MWKDRNVTQEFTWSKMKDLKGLQDKYNCMNLGMITNANLNDEHYQ